MVIFAFITKFWSKIKMHLLAEWRQRKPGHLEVLLAERNADDGDAEQQAESDVTDPRPEPTADQPKQIQRDADTARRAIRTLHL